MKYIEFNYTIRSLVGFDVFPRNILKKKLNFFNKSVEIL